MKNIITTILLIICLDFFVHSQVVKNQLTATHFKNIKINGVAIGSVENTYGEESAIKNLFGSPISIDKEGEFTEGAISRSFYYPGLRLGFSSFIGAEGNFSRFEIFDSTSKLTVKSITIRVGDHISKLGNVSINQNKDGSRGVVFVPDYDETVYLSINFHPNTGIIEKIIYFVMT